MRESSDVVGKPVISIDEGRQLGTVKDLYLDQPLSRVKGIHLGREGLLKRKPRFIAREAILLIGADAVLVNSAGAVLDGEKDARWEEWVRRDQVRGREVTTPGGTRLGRIGDVLVDPEADVSGFKLDRVFVEGPVNEHQTLIRTAVLDPGDSDRPMIARLSDMEEQNT
ncbi:MAG: PRC-barrel domain-containing protein [Candidatus Promineifilaceae bacterium]|nr:PRC-barrel domain-containing protein [Candidatus Promineifilaceae bacterium]